MNNKPHYLQSTDKKSFILYRADHTPTPETNPKNIERAPKVWGQYPSLQELQKASRNLFGELAQNAKEL
jgi:hypothetical protein